MPTVRVHCSEKNCAYYSAPPDARNPTECDCSHPQKPHYMTVIKCPLFRMNWVQANTGADKAKELIRAKRRL